MRISAALPTGVAALFFDSARRHRQLEQSLIAGLEEAGYSEVILPVIDYVDPYERLPSLVSRDELYRFIDRDGEVLALRSDFTPLLARLLAPRLGALERPLKLCYRGDVLRYQEERPGRLRELYQLGAEHLSDDGDRAEIAVLRQFLASLTHLDRERAADAPPWRVILGFAGALDHCLLAARSAVEPAVLAAAVGRRERRLARRGGELLAQIVEDGLPADDEALGEKAAARLARLRAAKAELEVEFPQIVLRIDLAEFADQVLAPELRRELAHRTYYDGLVFQAFAGKSALPVGGGGRYDRLFKRLGADDIAASGFSFSLDRLLACSTSVASAPWEEHR